MIYPQWGGKDVLPTKSAAREIVDEDIPIRQIVDTLETGYDCERSRRRPEIRERCKRFGKIVVKVVVADMGDHFRIIHVGKFR
ncbi:MAG TPA: hypothetical protein VJI13_01820 [Candidatus Norongarragalinales archaeon]|nr:hypothetical protein [Candidatus Norongarragalinales archaeon]